MMDMTLDDYGCHAPHSRGLAFLKQDVGHMKRIREHETREAKLEALLERCRQALVNGNKSERLEVAGLVSAAIEAGPSQV